MNKKCLNCIHYKYEDTKQYPGGQYNWGYCHMVIDETRRNDEEFMEDLMDYFQVLETHFCGYLKEL